MDIPFNKPTLPPYSLFNKGVKASYDSEMITNGQAVRRFEASIQDTFKVGNAVAVSCCTNGLMLALRCLGSIGKLALPRFTFFTSAHVVVWNGLEPVFVDVEPDSWNVSPAALERALEKENDIHTVMPVHVFGNPCDVAGLEALARKNSMSLIYDSAHGMGAKVGERWIGV